MRTIEQNVKPKRRSGKTDSLPPHNCYCGDRGQDPPGKLPSPSSHHGLHSHLPSIPVWASIYYSHSALPTLEMPTGTLFTWKSVVVGVAVGLLNNLARGEQVGAMTEDENTRVIRNESWEELAGGANASLCDPETVKRKHPRVTPTTLFYPPSPSPSLRMPPSG